MLCSLCNQLEQYAYLNGDDSYHSLPDYSLNHLETSSDSCDLCRLLLSKAQLYPQVHEDGIELSITSGKALYLSKNEAGSAIYNDTFPLCTPPYPSGESKVSENKGPSCEGRLTHDNSSNLACMDLAKSWLQECLGSHERCNKVKVSELPTRLLDVADPSSPGVIRVVNTDGIELKYIALSHTWGDSQPVTTTWANLETRMNYIAFWELPATFRDAVTITRFMGCRYLWIDSLCIIQDSVEDWQQESAKMRHVYRGSLVTISALSSANSEAGILGPRPPKTAIELTQGKSPCSGPVFVTPNPESWNELFRRTVLNTRGWTMQERVLSPRLLHYSDDEILWECLTCVQRERSRTQFAKIIPSSFEESYSGPIMDVNMPPADRSKNMAVLSLLKEWGSGENKDPNLTWCKAVSNYSSRKLTYEKDKLPAISGLAAEMRLQTNDDYLAGLWREDLLNGLCWRLYPGSDASSFMRSLSFRAPSWSWASIDGKIDYLGPPKGITHQEMLIAELLGSYVGSSLDETMNPVVLQAQVQPLGLDSLGEVSSGLLSLNCIGFQAIMIPDPRSPSFQEDHKVLLVVERHNFPTVPWPFDDERVGYRGIIDSGDDGSYPSCISIPIARRSVEYVDNVVALLVTPVPGAPGVFRRIGISWMREEMASKLFGCWNKEGDHINLDCRHSEVCILGQELAISLFREIVCFFHSFRHDDVSTTGV